MTETYKPHEVLMLVQSQPHGSSGKGMSYWRSAARCGRMAILDAKDRARRAESRPEPQDMDGEINKAERGVAYHALMEHDLRGTLENVAWDAREEAFNPSFKDALRLYRAYKRDWGSVLQKWGATHGEPEVLVPSTEVGREAARSFMGDDDTGRLDAWIYIPDSALAGVAERTGLNLPGEGVYLLDHKTGQQLSARDVFEYSMGEQSINYLYLYNLEHPEAPARGMIFDKIIAHAEISMEDKFAATGRKVKSKSYHHYLAEAMPGDEEIVQNLIQIGKHNVDNNIANPAQCFAGAIVCPHLKSGRCDRK